MILKKFTEGTAGKKGFPSLHFKHSRYPEIVILSDFL